jgi:N-glycosylase/DNA lyase
MSFKGIGPKVADCVCLFGYHKTKAFPVDTWIEKVYHEDFKGKLKDRNKISDYFISEFGENSGYFQQYLFYFKRSKEKLTINN